MADIYNGNYWNYAWDIISDKIKTRPSSGNEEHKYSPCARDCKT
jgi:hypothetical protein